MDSLKFITFEVISGYSDSVQEVEMRMSISARLVLTIGLVGMSVVGPRAETRTSEAMNAKEKANLQHVRSWWLECLEGRNLEATAKYQADSYIQHNINFPTGRAGFMKIFGDR